MHLGCAKLSESLYRAGRLARTSSHFGLECMRERTDALDRAVAGVNTDPGATIRLIEENGSETSLLSRTMTGGSWSYTSTRTVTYVFAV